MKKLIFIAILDITSSCTDKTFCDYDCQINKQFPTLKPPIVLVAKDCDSWAGCNALVQDATGRTLYMGNMSSMGKIIGSSYSIGDTLKLR